MTSGSRVSARSLALNEKLREHSIFRSPRNGLSSRGSLVRIQHGSVPMVYSVANGLESPPMVALLRALYTPVEPRYLGPGITTFVSRCC